MATNTFIGGAAAVKKRLYIGLQNGSVDLSDKTIKIGLGSSLLEFTGWTPADIASEWSNSTDALLSTISCEVPTDTYRSLLSPLMLTHKTAGEDFHVTLLIDDVATLVASASFLLSFPSTITSGTFTITIFGEESGPITWSATPSTLVTNIQNALNAMTAIESGDVIVTSVTSTTYELDLSQGKYAGQTISPAPTVDADSLLSSGPILGITKTQAGSAGSNAEATIHFNILPEYDYTDEVQRLTPQNIDNSVTGTYKLSIDGSEWTTDLDIDASNATIIAALEALTAIGSGNVDVTGGTFKSGSAKTISYIGSLLDTDVDEIQVDATGLDSGLPSPSITIQTIQEGNSGASAVNTKFTVKLSSTSSGGSFTLKNGATESDPINYNDNDAAITTALETAYGAGNVSVTNGPIDNTNTVTVELIGSLAATDVAKPTISDNSITNATEIEIVTIQESSTPRETIQTLGLNDAHNTNNTVSGSTGITQFIPATRAAGQGQEVEDVYYSPNSLGTSLVLTAWAGHTISQATGWFTLAFKNNWGATITTDQISVSATPYDVELAILNAQNLWENNNATTIASTPKYSTGLRYTSVSPTYSKATNLNIPLTSLPNGFPIVSINSQLTVAASAITNADISWAENANSYYSIGYLFVSHKGTVKFVLDSVESDEVDVSATQEELVAALESIPAIGAGNIQVFGRLTNAVDNTEWGGATPITIQLIGTKAGTRMSNLSIIAGTGYSSRVYNSQTFSNSDSTSSSGTTIGWSTSHSNGEVETPQIDQIRYVTTAPNGSLNFSSNLTALEDSTSYSPTNSSLLAALATVLGFAPTLTNGPLLTSAVNVNYGSYGNVALSVEYIPAETITVTKTQAGHAGGTGGVPEIQKVTISDATGGTFTLTQGSNTTADIAYPATPASVKSALNAASISVASVTGAVTGPYTVTFSANTDVAQMTGDAAGLENVDPTAPTIIPSTVTEGGQGSIIGGLLGGTFALHITKGGTTYDVLNIPYNATNDMLDTMIEAVTGTGTVTVTGGQLPDNDVTLEFTGDFGLQSITVTYTSTLNVEGSSSYEVAQLKRATTPSPRNNVYELTVIPGDGTPGVRWAGTDATYNDDQVSFCLKIETPNGVLSEEFAPETQTTDPPVTCPNLVYIHFSQLNAMRIEEIINEAFGEQVVSVTRIVHSIEHKEIVYTNYGNVTTPRIVKTWFYRDVYRLTFINNYADPSSISSITMQLPDSPTNPGHPIGPTDFFNFDDADADNDNVILGDLSASGRGDDSATESARIAFGFYIADLQDQPLHKFDINYVDVQTPYTLSWRYNIQSQYLANDGSPVSIGRVGIADILSGCKLQFHWCGRKRTNEGGSSRETTTFDRLSSTIELDWDASPEEIRAAIEDIFIGSPQFFGEGNVSVTGSLYNSWLSNPYQTYGVVNTEADNWDEQYHELVVSLTGLLAHLPLNTYEYCLRCTLRNPYGQREDAEIGDLGSDNYIPSQSSVENAASSKSARIFWEENTKPFPKLINDRFRVTVEGAGPTTALQLGIGNELISITGATTAAQLQTLINTRLGYIDTENTTTPYQDRQLYFDEGDPNNGIPPQWTYQNNPVYQYDPIMPVSMTRAVTVSGTQVYKDSFEIEFTGYGYQFSEAPAITLSVPQTNPPITITNVTLGSPQQPTIFTLAITGGTATSGTFILHYDGNNSDPLDYNADLMGLQFAIDSIVGASSVADISGTTIDAGPVVVTMDQSLNDVTTPTVTSSLHGTPTVSVSTTAYGGISGTLVVMEAVKGAGPNFFDVAANWSLGRIPGCGDAIVIDDATQAIKYGIDFNGQFQVAGSDGKFISSNRRRVWQDDQAVYVYPDVESSLPTGLTEGYYYIVNSDVDASFYLSTTKGGDPVVSVGPGVGNLLIQLRNCTMTVYSRYGGSQIGLPRQRSSTPEYLPTYLAIGLTSLIVGEEDGTGLSLGHFNTLNETSNIDIKLSDSSQISNIPAILLLANNVDTNIIVGSNANVGLAVYSDESAIVNDITVADGGSIMIRNSAVHGTVTGPTDGVSIRGSTVPAVIG